MEALFMMVHCLLVHLINDSGGLEEARQYQEIG
jgi:hypothetical protein